MTEKKENILNAALELFVSEGYNATPTSRIAKKAGVSEGLIFKHFTNKRGLLDAIVLDTESRISQIFSPILFETDPLQVITKYIELPHVIGKEEYDFWKLQFKLKWEEAYNNPNKMKPVIDKLTWAFTELGYAQPGQEAELLYLIVDAISISILRDGRETDPQFLTFLIAKYKG